MLTQEQTRTLKARAHSLKPVVMAGQKGITDALLAELDGALEHHELLKMKFTGSSRDQRISQIDEVCERSGATCVQIIGSVAVLFRASRQKQKKSPVRKHRPARRSAAMQAKSPQRESHRAATTRRNQSSRRKYQRYP